MQGGVKVFPELSNNNCHHGSHVEASRPVFLLQWQLKGHKICLPVRRFFPSKLACFTLGGSETNSALRATAAGVAARASRTRGKPVELSEQKKMAGCKKCLHWYAFIHLFATYPHYQHFLMFIRKSNFFRTDPSTRRIQIITILRVSWRLPYTPVCWGIIYSVSSGKKYQHS